MYNRKTIKGKSMWKLHILLIDDTQNVEEKE
jgi:hypothetical protein